MKHSEPLKWEFVGCTKKIKKDGYCLNAGRGNMFFTHLNAEGLLISRWEFFHTQKFFGYD